MLRGFQDPKLPTNDVDVAFFHDSLHHIRDRKGYLKLLASHLKPNGRVVVIDLIDGHRDDPELQIDVESVVGWMKVAGFQRSQTSICSRINFSWYSDGNHPGMRA